MIIPTSRPKITKEESEKIVNKYLRDSVPPLVIIGVRGYYSKSLGQTSDNEINIWDDAMIIWGAGVFKTFNGNTDPSFAQKGLATLNTGVYNFYRGKHKGKYNALRAYPEGISLPCTRDGKPSMCSVINIHMGGEGTWSAGCQTLPKKQWTQFIELVYEQMTRHSMKTVPYILISQEQMEECLKN